MYGVYEKRIGELHGVKTRLESRLREVIAEIDFFEDAAQRASHPLDVCVCPEGTCVRCGVISVNGSANWPTSPPSSLEDCGTIEEVCEYLAVNNPNGDMTIKLGDAVRACKNRGWDLHLNNNSYRSKIAKRLGRSDHWDYLGEGTYRFLGGAAIDGFARHHESDMRAYPDPSTFTLLPWRPRQNAVARVFCDIRQPRGQTFPGDPR